MNTETPASGIIYLRHIPKAGKPFIQYHTVWDRDRFLESISDAKKKEGGSVKVVTEDDYRKEKWPNEVL